MFGNYYWTSITNIKPWVNPSLQVQYSTWFIGKKDFFFFFVITGASLLQVVSYSPP